MKNRDYIFSVDLGSSDIVVAAGREGASGGLSVDAVSIQPSAGVAQGEVKNIAEVATSVKRAVEEVERQLGVSVRDATIGISGDHVRCVQHPYYVYVSGSDGEIVPQDVASLNESMRHVQVSDGYVLMHTVPQHYLIDDMDEAVNPVGMFGRTLGSVFNLVVGNSVTTSRTAKTMERVGVRPAHIFVNPLAAADAVTTPDEREIGVAVVDMGAGTTDVCIYQRGVIRYVGVIPLGTDSINKDIRSYGIMERYVEELKVKWGCASPESIEDNKLVWTPGRVPGETRDISLENLAAIIQARLLDILDYVSDEIEASGYKDKVDAGIVLTGGGAMIREIVPLAARRTGMDVRIGLPDSMVDADSMGRVSDPRVAAAVGLLLMTLRSEGVTLDAPAPGQKTRPEEPEEEERAKFPPEEEWDEEDELPEDKPVTEKPPRKGNGLKGIFGRINRTVEKVLRTELIDEEEEEEEDELQ